MLEISVKTLWYCAAGGVVLVAWFIRLESRVILNKNELNSKLKAVNLKVDNHIASSKEKYNLIFGKIENMERSIAEIKTSVAVIAEHLKKG